MTLCRCATFLLSESCVRIDGASSTQSPHSHIALNSVENPLRDERVARMREHVGKVIKAVVIVHQARYYKLILLFFNCKRIFSDWRQSGAKRCLSDIRVKTFISGVTCLCSLYFRVSYLKGMEKVMCLLQDVE